MMKSSVICLAAVAMLLTSAAVADNTTSLPTVLAVPQGTGASCARLQRQFDAEIGAHGSAPGAPTARMKRQKGEQRCNRGDYDGGVKDLARALRAIGVTPSMQ
jgi:hypothetical protein